MKEKEKAEPELFLFSILTRCKDLYSVYIFSPNILVLLIIIIDISDHHKWNTLWYFNIATERDTLSQKCFLNPFSINVPLFSGGIKVERWLKMS